MKHLRIHTTNLSNGNCKLGLKKDFVEYLKVSKRRNKMEKELTTAQRELIKGANITPFLRASSDSIFNEIHTFISKQIDLLPYMVVAIGEKNDICRKFEEESGKEKYNELLTMMIDTAHLDVWKKIDDLKREMLEKGLVPK